MPLAEINIGSTGLVPWQIHTASGRFPSGGWVWQLALLYYSPLSAMRYLVYIKMPAWENIGESGCNIPVLHMPSMKACIWYLFGLTPVLYERLGLDRIRYSQISVDIWAVALFGTPVRSRQPMRARITVRLKVIKTWHTDLRHIDKALSSIT